ncbi:MAG: DNA-binding beta-propeller fold protein YncE [Chloroflexi bacterium]|nr:MAG: DNA-binding beta-propeller fold protein YncE [Chloroflexota bacterium]
MLFVANLRSSDVTLVDVASATVIGRWETPGNPHEFAYDGDRIFWSNYRSRQISTLWRAGGGPAVTQPAGGPRAHGLAVDGAGVLWWTTADGYLRSSGGAAIRVGATPHAVAIDAATGRAYVAEAGDGAIAVVDLETERVRDRAPAGALAESIALDASGTRVVVAAADAGRVTLFAAESLEERWRVALTGRPVRVVIAGERVLVSLALSGELAVLNLADGALIARVAVGRLPDGIATDGSGRYAFVATAGDGAVTIVEVARGTVVGALPAGEGPSGLLWRPR